MGDTKARPRLNRPAAQPGLPATPTRDRRWTTALIVLACAGVIRLVIGGLTPLFPDETYYWEWSRRLAIGYFDHPPMIAWLIRGGTSIAGHTALGVRLVPILAGVIAGWFVVLGARRLGGSGAALVAALIFALMPLSAAGLIIATPDAPLFAAAAACVYALVRAIEATERRVALAWWSVAGIALGVAALSKYTAVLLAVGTVVAVLARRELRSELSTSGPYVGTLLAIAVFSPVIIWNAEHDWASFAFQLTHGFGGAGGSVINRELELVGGQLGLVTPILLVMMIIAMRRGSGSARALLAVLCATVLLFFAYSATRRRVEANWPALAYVPGIMLLAAHAANRTWRTWLRAGIALAALLTIVTYANTFTPVLPVPARRDPVARSAGWDHLAAQVNRLYAPRLPISSYRTWVAADRYQETSELAFHLPGNPEVFSLNLTTRPNQYGLWPGFTDRAQPRDGLILVADETAQANPTVEALRPHFELVQPDSMVTLAREGDPVKYLRIWLLQRWRGTWPRSALR